MDVLCNVGYREILLVQMLVDVLYGIFHALTLDCGEVSYFLSRTEKIGIDRIQRGKTFLLDGGTAHVPCGHQFAKEVFCAFSAGCRKSGAPELRTVLSKEIKVGNQDLV